MKVKEEGRAMRLSWLLRTVSVATCIALYPASPATAGRTVVDGGSIMTLTGYCSPETATNTACTPYALPTALQIGGTTYNQFWVNSNGSVSLGNIESFMAPYNVEPPPPANGSLLQYGSIPVFSPNFMDGAGYFDFTTQNYDGSLVAQTALTATGFTVDWFFCSDPLNCGSRTATLVAGATFDPNEVGNFGLVDALIAASTLNDPNATDLQNFLSGQQFLIAQANNSHVFTMTLAGLASGFQVDYTYNAAAGPWAGVYGFSLPTAQLDTFGLLQDRTFVFDSNGALANAVPEPSTWISMLLGFGLAGFVLRRQRRRQALA
jgi:hypothetical protein